MRGPIGPLPLLPRWGEAVVERVFVDEIQLELPPAVARQPVEQVDFCRKVVGGGRLFEHKRGRLGRLQILHEDRHRPLRQRRVEILVDINNRIGFDMLDRRPIPTDVDDITTVDSRSPPEETFRLGGVVSNLEGEPVIGARIDISTAAPKSGSGLFCPSCYSDCAKTAKSDKQGRFEFTGLNPTLKFRLLATAPDMQTAVTDLLDPTQDTASITLLSFPSDTSEDRVLRGEVVSTEAVPISGALVYPCGAKTAKRRWGGRVDGAKAVVTDDDGRFRMLLTEDFVAVDVEVTAHGYPGATAEQLRPGEDSHTITVPSGTSVTGRLTFRGRPGVDRSVAVVQVNRGRSDRIFVKAVLGTTDDAGRFEFNALPADEPYAIFTPVGSGVTGPVLATTLFNAMADGATYDIGELQLRPGLTIAGHLQTTDDTEIPDEVRLTLGRMPAWDLIEVPVDTAGSFRIENLPPETYDAVAAWREHPIG